MKQKNRGLEEQVGTLKEELSKQMQQKQSFISRTAQKSEEIKTLRNQLSDSLVEVTRSGDFSTLERETMKLDDTIDIRHNAETSTPAAPSNVLISSTPLYRRPKSESPHTLDLSKYDVTPTTDPGPTRHATPATTTYRSRIGTSFVSPLRKSRTSPAE